MIQLHGQIRVIRLYGKINLVPSEGSQGGPLQAKTVYPSHSEQIVTPDEDYYGLVAVTVKPIPRLPACLSSVEYQGEIVVDSGAAITVESSVTAEDYTT